MSSTFDEIKLRAKHLPSFLMLVGAGVAAIALLAVPLGIDSQPRFSAEKILLISFGLACLSIGVALRLEWTESNAQSPQDFARSTTWSLSVAALCLATMGFLWWRPKSAPLPGKIVGQYSIDEFISLLVATYILCWGVYFVFNRQVIRNKIANFILSTLSLCLIFGLLELPAILELVDYRMIIAPPQSVLFNRFKPWQNPMYKLDRELGWIRPPSSRIAGEGVGDLVHWLGIATDQRYMFEVQYDSKGFRNDHDIQQAPVVVIGDSFVDWPIIPQSDLLSNRLSGALQVEVANLGHTGYGPQQEMVVLQRYGLPLRPRIILWLFFEGNDLLDVPRYDSLVRNWSIEEMHSFKERSFTKNALLGLAALTEPELKRNAGEAERRSCSLAGSRGDDEVKMYFAYAGSPLSKKDLVSLDKAQQVFLKAHENSMINGAQFLFVYVPTKFRVYGDLCQFPEDGYGRDWVVNDLPEMLGSWAAENEISYIDLTPALQEAAARGELVFFTDDGHWNARGNEVAAETILHFLDQRGLLLTVSGQ